MKKILLGILLGFILHKATNEVYDYTWWKHSDYCYDLVNDIKPYEPDAVIARNACFKEKQGLAWYLQYVLTRPQIGRNRYFSMEKGWGF